MAHMKCNPKSGDSIIYPGYQIQMILWRGTMSFHLPKIFRQFPSILCCGRYGGYGRCDHWFFEGFSESSERAVVKTDST